MQNETVNGVRLAYEIDGSGDASVLLVHGSWSSHRTWDALRSGLPTVLRVIAYDRRGHSASERPPGQGTFDEDVDDAAALLEALDLAPAYVVGNSFGAEVAIRLGVKHPEVVRGVIAHEPAFVRLLADKQELRPLLDETERRIAAVVDLIRRGDHAAAAERFAETVALGPGSWARLSEDRRRTWIENAQTFLDEETAPDTSTIDLSSLGALQAPVLLTHGDASSPLFAPIVSILGDAIPHAEILTIPGAGHVPHMTHPGIYAEAITAFIAKHEEG